MYEFWLDLSVESDNSQSDESRSNAWTHHELVNCIADFFCLPELAKMNTQALDKLIQESWSADSFCDLLCITLDKTGD